VEQKVCYRQVSVECPGYASITFDEQLGSCRTDFASGTCVETHQNGSYGVVPSDGGFLQIDECGTAFYTAMKVINILCF